MGKQIKNNTLNELDTQEWVARLHSIQRYDWQVPKELAPHLHQGTLTPPLLAAQIISFFTKPHAQIFDPFAGEGGILVGAAIAQRLATGCDLSVKVTKAAAAVGAHYGFPAGKGWWAMTGGVDALAWLRWQVEERGFAETQDLMFTDPPFGINHGRTVDKGGSVPFDMVSKKKGDIGAYKEWNHFYRYIGQVADLSCQLLKPGAYALWWLGDRFRGGHYRVVGAEAQPYIEENSGLKLKGVQHFVPNALNVRRQVFGWGKVFSPLVDHVSLWIYRKES